MLEEGFQSGRLLTREDRVTAHMSSHNWQRRKANKTFYSLAFCYLDVCVQKLIARKCNFFVGTVAFRCYLTINI